MRHASSGRPKTNEELHGLVYGMEIRDVTDTAPAPWFRQPVLMGVGVLGLSAGLYLLTQTL